MARDAEIPMDDSELDAIMAELEAETLGTVEAPKSSPPAPATPTTKTEVMRKVAAEKGIPILRRLPVDRHMDGAPAAVVEEEEKPPIKVAPQIPPEAMKSKRVTTEQKVEAIMAAGAAKDAAHEESTFVVPAHVGAVADPLPWEDRPDIGIVASATCETATAVAMPATTVAAAGPMPTDTVAAATLPEAGTVQVAPVKARPVTLQHSIDVGEFKADTAISETNIDQAMMEQNSLRATYGQLARNAEAQASRCKLQAEVKEAELYDKHRKLLAAGGEKVTEKAVENAVKLDPVWIRIKNRVIEAETIAGVNKELVESLKDRRDMLIQMGADRREEGKGQVRTLERDLRDRERTGRPS